jgi:ABC-2 type transport system ATP-binding protein
VGEPELLVHDEPTDGLDPPGRAEVRALLARRIAAGATVVLNSHLLTETERICARVGILVGGRVVREGPLEEVTGGGDGLPGEWTARFAPGAPAEALRAAGFTARGGERWSIAAAGPGPLNAAIDRVRAAGAELVELTPEGQDLEAALAAAMAPGDTP